MEFLFFWIFFTGLVGWWADQWGRKVWQFVLLSLICAPIVSAIILMIMGRDYAVLEDRARNGNGGGDAYKTCRGCRNRISRVSTNCGYCGQSCD